MLPSEFLFVSLSFIPLKYVSWDSFPKCQSNSTPEVMWHISIINWIGQRTLVKDFRVLNCPGSSTDSLWPWKVIILKFSCPCWKIRDCNRRNLLFHSTIYSGEIILYILLWWAWYASLTNTQNKKLFTSGVWVLWSIATSQPAACFCKQSFII